MPDSTLRALCSLKRLEHVLLHVCFVPSCMKLHVGVVRYSTVLSRHAASYKKVQSKHAALTVTHQEDLQLCIENQTADGQLCDTEHSQSHKGGAAGVRDSELLELGFQRSIPQQWRGWQPGSLR